MSKVMLPVVVTALMLTGCTHQTERPTPIDPEAKLSGLSVQYWRSLLDNGPTWASYLGHRPYDGRLPDLSAEGRARHDSSLQSIRESLSQIDLSTLSADSRTTADVLKSRLDTHFASKVCQEWAWVVDQLSGPQVWLGELPSYHIIDGPNRADSLLQRYGQIDVLLRQQIFNLRAGAADGWLASKINVTRVVEQLDTLLAQEVHKSAFVAPVLQRASGVDPGILRERLSEVVQSHVYPALRVYRDFLAQELSPKSRMSVGVSHLPRGRECYAARIKRHTGLDLTAEQIHSLGLHEVSRIKKQMQNLVSEMGGADVESFLADLADTEEQHLNSRDELLEYNRRLVERARRVIPKLVGRIPRTPLIVKPIEAFRERDAPAAYYYRAPSDGSRPAAYYLNTHAPKTRLLYKMAALAFHEALPGHHLQIALAGENQTLPNFMRHGGQTAFVEGWALYSERLADEFALYETAEEKLGALTYEIWRAARLVVDTGLHAMGWSRERAIDYLALHTGHDPGEVINEIDRYIIWPGQALAYKMGQLEISRLRQEVEDTLGDGFDLRAFHDQVLHNGALPMGVLRRVIERWLGREISDKN